MWSRPLTYQVFMIDESTHELRIFMVDGCSDHWTINKSFP